MKVSYFPCRRTKTYNTLVLVFTICLDACFITLYWMLVISMIKTSSNYMGIKIMLTHKLKVLPNKHWMVYPCNT